uniref:Uncharacterized protein ycf35 n=1 Tax=Nitophyllum punctatum TaxID=158729 RepID=A0A4D6WW72_9FLOR|nr:hypothetical protein [Nitophyllum punctatum]
MSHFSKIKTSMSNLELLKLTLRDLGFVFHINEQCLQLDNYPFANNMTVLDKFNNYIFSCVWNGSQYELLADLQVWTLDFSPKYLIEKLHQQYAYNVIIKESKSGGFEKKAQIVMSDGSIKITMERSSIKY